MAAKTGSFHNNLQPLWIQGDPLYPPLHRSRPSFPVSTSVPPSPPPRASPLGPWLLRAPQYAPVYVAALHKAGLLRHNAHKMAEVLGSGAVEGLSAHGHLDVLRPYSALVTFVYRMRTFFLNEFAAAKADFPAIDGEALFLGTVLHSLDHAVGEVVIREPTAFDCRHPHLACMAEVGTFVRSCIMTDLPGLLWRHRYSDSPHPFFQRVHAHAVEVNPRLAAFMDTCIIK